MSIIPLACLGFCWVLSPNLPVAACADICPQLLTMGFWTEWISLQLFVFNKNRFAVPRHIALGEQMSNTVQEALRGGAPRERRGWSLDFGVCLLALELPGLSCLQDPPCPAVGWGAALPGSLVVLLGHPLTSEFPSSRFFQGPSRNSVYSSQCSLWTESVGNICFLWPSAICSLGCGP